MFLNVKYLQSGKKDISKKLRPMVMMTSKVIDCHRTKQFICRTMTNFRTYIKGCSGVIQNGSNYLYYAPLPEVILE